MKLSDLFMIKFIAAILLFGFIMSCESHGDEGENAFESFQESRLMTGDSASINSVEETIEEPIIAHRKDKKEILNEWAQFNVDMEKKLAANENRIVEIKEIPHLSVDAFDKVTALESDNHGMRLELYDYIEVNPERHEKFKIKYAEGINSIKADLDELKIKAQFDALMLLE